MWTSRVLTHTEGNTEASVDFGLIVTQCFTTHYCFGSVRCVLRLITVLDKYTNLKDMKTSPDKEVRELYEDTADSYSKMMDSEIELPIYSDTLSRLAVRIAELPGTIIDTSCGSGHMLELYHNNYDSSHSLIGVDLSPKMVEIADKRLGTKAKTFVGNMLDLGLVSSKSSAAVISFFAIHHLDTEEVILALREWHRLLVNQGQIVLATWEGEGTIDYGDESDVVALKFTQEQIESWVIEAGFVVDRCIVEPVEEIPMDAIYLEASKLWAHY